MGTWLTALVCMTCLTAAWCAAQTPPVGLTATATAQRPFAAPGETVQLNLQLTNGSNAAQTFSNIELTIEGPSGYRQPVWTSDRPIPLAPSASRRIGRPIRWSVPPSAASGAYFAVLTAQDATGQRHQTDAGFVRVLPSPLPPPTFTIEHERYKGLPIFKLRGGMSAEYAVQKALANLAAGVSHSWYTQSPGRGPDPIYASPAFLEESARQTVAYYDDYLGRDRVYETVIISTGVATVPYLSRVTQAPVLPLHFLTSAGSVREVRAVLDRSAQSGTSAYAVLGYDASMPNLGVAWIKLIDLPQAYRDFLKRHQTRRVLIVGTTGTFGETLARRTLHGPDAAPAGSAPITAGDVFLLYTSASGLPFPQRMSSAEVFASPAFAGDLRQLEKRIADLHQVPLEDGFTRINDWESGVSQAQIDGLVADLHEIGIEATLVSVEPKVDEVLYLYDLSAHLMLEFYLKNEQQIRATHSDARLIRGVALNPYMISQPFYESRMGYLPMLFWQGNDADFLVNHLRQLISACLHAAPGGQKLDDLHYWINVTHNFNFFRYPASAFVDRLRSTISNNISVELNPATVDEVWNLRDGVNASCEHVAEALLKSTSPADLQRWNASLQPLTVDDLKRVQSRFGKMVVRDLQPPTSAASGN